MKPLANVDMCSADCDALRDWTSSYGAAVRRRIVRQETTMAQHGTFPEFMYQRQCEIAEEPIYIYIAFVEQINTAEAVTENEMAEEAGDEFGERNDEEVGDGPEVSTLVQGEIGSSVTFLQGAGTLFRRALRFNNRLLY